MKHALTLLAALLLAPLAALHAEPLVAMNVSSGRTLLRRDLPTMPQFFSAAGCATGIFGKWHLGDTFPYRPEDRGFSEALWFPSSHIGAVPDFWENDYFDDTYIRNGARQRYAGYTTDVFFREAIAWMKQQAVAGKPFLCYLPNGVLLGQKTDAWEGGHRVPLIARWPGRIPAGSERKALFTQIDIMATLSEAARVELPPGASPDGMSDLAAFTDPGRVPAKRTEALFQGTGSYALRQGDWLYIPKQGSGGMTVQVPPRAPWGLPYAEMNQRNSDIDPQGKVQPGAPPAQLYNLRDDLSQTTNRFRDQPATTKRLAARMEQLLPKPKRPGKP